MKHSIDKIKKVLNDLTKIDCVREMKTRIESKDIDDNPLKAVDVILSRYKITSEDLEFIEALLKEHCNNWSIEIV